MKSRQLTPVGRVVQLRTLLVCLLVSGSACTSVRPVSLRQGAREYVAADYDAILKRWTRSEHLYSLQGIDEVLAVTTTFEAWDFRWSYVIRYAEDYRLTIDQRRDLLARTLADARDTHQFYVTLYGAKPVEADLSREYPAWVVRLADDKGHLSAPYEIVAIRKPGALERAYFPYTNVWRSVFRVRFKATGPAGPAIDPDARVITLRFSGPLGNLDVTWKRER